MQEMRQEYDRLKAQEDSLEHANQEVDRLRGELKEARDSAADAQKRHQEEKQAVLDRMSTVTNGKVCVMHTSQKLLHVLPGRHPVTSQLRRSVADCLLPSWGQCCLKQTALSSCFAFSIGCQAWGAVVQDMEREKLQMQLQQQLQTSEDLVQELKSRLGREEAAVRDLKSENTTLSGSANQAKVPHISFANAPTYYTYFGAVVLCVY